MMQATSLLTDAPLRASLHFAAGIPGFPHLRAFTIERWGGDESPFMTMTADQDPDVGFVVVSPFLYYPEYQFDLDDATAERLGICGPEDVHVFCIVTLYERPEDATREPARPGGDQRAQRRGLPIGATSCRLRSSSRAP